MYLKSMTQDLLQVQRANCIKNTEKEKYQTSSLKILTNTELTSKYTLNKN